MQGMGVVGNNTRYDKATYIGCGSYSWWPKYMTFIIIIILFGYYRIMGIASL